MAGFLLLLALAGGVYAILVLRNGSAAAPPAENNREGVETGEQAVESAEVLPQQRREDEASDSAGRSFFEPVQDPFADPMRLSGIVHGGRGGSMAIIESGGTSYIVSEGDYVDDIWAVREIGGGRVVLRAYTQEVSLFLDQPPQVRSLDPAQ